MRVKLLLMLLMSLSAVAACSGGGGGGGSSDPQLTVHKAFVTSVTGSGNLSAWADANGKTGLAAADAVCQTRATAAGLSGTFVAWLSDSSNDAFCRIHGLSGKRAGDCGGLYDWTKPAGPWVRTDGVPFALAADQLIVKQTTYTPARMDEFGVELLLNYTYFTGTSTGGAVFAGTTCGDWTDGTAATSGTTGYFQATGSSWTNSGTSPCSDTSNRLLCMQTGQGSGLGNFAQSGKKVFVSSVTGTGSFSAWASAGTKTGAAAGDQVCQTLAGSAGLANPTTFKAWVSTSTTSAPDRLTSNGPWVRVDGIKVADNKADLLDGSLFTSINVAENGVYLSSQVYAWTGTTGTGGPTANTCGDWTDGSGFAFGTFGEGIDARAYWTEYYSIQSCDHLQRLYCFEDN